MKPPGKNDTHQITAIPKNGKRGKVTIQYGTPESLRKRMAHIRQQKVRYWQYQIEEIPKND